MSSHHSYTFIEPDGKKIQGNRYKNPDGSVGGWVAENASVAKTAFIEAGAVVEPKAIVQEGSRVKAGIVVSYKTSFPS